MTPSILKPEEIVGRTVVEVGAEKENALVLARDSGAIVFPSVLEDAVVVDGAKFVSCELKPKVDFGASDTTG